MTTTMKNAKPSSCEVSLTYATIGGRQVEWHELIAAATQDHETRLLIADGSVRPGWRSPNGEHSTADAYRDLLRAMLPLIAAAEKAAYELYCSRVATTRGSDPVHLIGYGSWVYGPDGASQAAWYGWKSLRERVTAALQPPAARCDPGRDVRGRATGSSPSMDSYLSSGRDARPNTRNNS